MIARTTRAKAGNRKYRRESALARQALYNGLTLEERRSLAASRRGESLREMKRLSEAE